MMRLRRRATMEFSLERRLLFDVLSDYSGYAEWMPLFTASELLAREANFAVIDVELAPFGHRKMKAECVHAGNRTVVIRSLTGHVPAFRIDWTLSPAGEGRTAVELKTEWGIDPRTFLGLTRVLKPEADLKGLASHLSSFAAGGGMAADDAEEKIMEIMETEEGLICFYRGTKYLMKAAS